MQEMLRELSRQVLLGMGPATRSVGEERNWVPALSVHFLSFTTGVV